ncbi:hypothetical protein HanRHA438_Chr13g0614791 [Helianthus annuus]|nr:hypothetical protein HanRHA438_Chr13g0614791 [Helianthus annuus]
MEPQPPLNKLSPKNHLLPELIVKEITDNSTSCCSSSSSIELIASSEDLLTEIFL